MHFIYILIFRIINAYFINSLFEPDETYQNIDPVYFLLLNNCELTWDWKCGLRSFMYPLIFYIPGLLLKYILVGLFGPENWKPIFMRINFYLIKLIVALCAAISDLCTNKLAEYFNIKTGNILLEHGLLLYTCRSHINTLEMHLTSICAYLFTLYKFKRKVYIFSIAVFLMAYGAYLRPTFLFIIYPYYVQHMFTPSLLLISVLIGLPSLLFFISVDFIFYGEFIIPTINFLKYNIYYKISHLFGTMPKRVYLFWFIILCGYNAIDFIFNFFTGKNRRIFFFLQLPVISYILLYMTASHKEMRFILPAIPFTFILCGKNNIFLHKYFLIILSFYLNYFHQNYAIIWEARKILCKSETLSIITIPYSHPHNLFLHQKINALYGNIEINTLLPNAKIYEGIGSRTIVNDYNLFFVEFYKNLRNISSDYVIIDDRIFYYSQDILHEKYKIYKYFLFSRDYFRPVKTKVQFILRRK